MKVLQVVKTSDGAAWAAHQVAELVKLGIEVHVALPSATGRMIAEWRASGAVLHCVNLDFPLRNPLSLRKICDRARKLVRSIRPDIIHSHFVGTTLVLRRALGDSGPIRIFQVPGPLHMEHAVYRAADLRTSSLLDHWIASSHYIESLYKKSGIPDTRLYVSYHGTRTEEFISDSDGCLRERLSIEKRDRIVGNISYIYPPKYYLGQFTGLKAHEDLIDALSIVTEKRQDVVGVLVGSTWGRNSAYEKRLRNRASKRGRGKIFMPGHFSADLVRRCWSDFDCAVHVPLSENCGGVVEPLMAGVPTIAGDVGGLPEVVIDKVTGVVVPIRDPAALAHAILSVLDNPQKGLKIASTGQALVRTMFDIRRTSREIAAVYEHLLRGDVPRPAAFCPTSFVREMRAAGSADDGGDVRV